MFAEQVEAPTHLSASYLEGFAMLSICHEPACLRLYTFKGADAGGRLKQLQRLLYLHEANSLMLPYLQPGAPCTARRTRACCHRNSCLPLLPLNQRLDVYGIFAPWLLSGGTSLAWLG